VCLRVFARAGGRTRHSDQVHVVGHEAVAQQRETVEVRILPQQLQIDKPVGIMNKNGLAGLAALGNMVGEIDDHEAGEPWGKRTRKLEAWGKLTLLGRSEPGRFPYWGKNRGTFRLSPYFSNWLTPSSLGAAFIVGPQVSVSSRPPSSGPGADLAISGVLSNRGVGPGASLDVNGSADGLTGTLTGGVGAGLVSGSAVVTQTAILPFCTGG
jgi:hypothetical protein